MGDLSNPFGMEYPKPLREGEEAKNWGLILHGKGDVRKEPRAFPDDPPAGQVQINVKMCGIVGRSSLWISFLLSCFFEESPDTTRHRPSLPLVGCQCGSDVHTFETGNMVGFPLQLPLVLGHEASGVITKVGPGVDNLKVGQAVAIHPWTAFGLLTTHINHPAMLCFPLPEGVDFRGGAYVEPLAVGLNAVRRANVGAGTNVAVLGAGPVGIASLVSAKAIGARKVVVTDLSDSRLEIAKANGADVVLNVKGMKPAEVATALAAAFKTTEAGKVDPMGLGWSLGELTSEIDAVVDAAGFADTVAVSIQRGKQ